MKALLIYWIIGCALYGMALGGRIIDCPNDEPDMKMADLAVVAAWPSSLVAAFIIPRGHKFPPTKCSVETP